MDPNYKLNKKDKSTETTLEENEEQQQQIMKSIEKRLGTSEARGEHPDITKKEERWVEVESSVVLGVEGKRETRVVNEDEMRKLTGR